MSLRQVVRLLLVDSDRPVHAALSRLIERQKLPYVLETAASQREAISRLRQASCDAVLLDCTHGNGRGCEIFEESQRHPVILLIDRGSNDAAVRAARWGACPCLVDTADDSSWGLLPAVVENLVTWKQRLARVRESEARFRLMADGAGVLLWTLGPDGRATSFNRPWLEFRGRRLQQELSEGWFDGVHPEDRQQARWAFHAALDARRECRVEYRLRRHDGQYRRMLDLRTPQYLPEGSFAGYVCLCIDATNQKQADEEARQRLGQIAHLERLSTVSEMVCELAHELSQPLGAISDYAQAGRHQARSLRGENCDQVIDFFGRITEQADRAGRIVRRVREFVRREDCHRCEVDINDLIRELVVLLEVDARSHHVRLELSLGRSLPKVTIDRTQIEQVITNLVRNAMEAAEEMPQRRRTVRIRTSLDDANGLEVVVVDKGRGLEAEEVERLFEPFYSGKADGMGLGLSISRSIVEAHGGRLEASPNVEQGTTLRFTLPIDGEGGER